MVEPIYIGDGESTEFMDVLPKTLTIRPILPEFYKDRWSRPDFTIFKEVYIKEYYPSEDILNFLREGKWERPTTYETVFWYLKKAISKVWKPEKFHLIGHSSGYDSRLICKAIRELTELNGEKWAGRVFYVENMGEKPHEDILNHLNLDGITYNRFSEPGWYHEYSLKFKDFHEKYNGVFAFPFNQWYDSFKELHEQRIIPEDVQGFTGYGAGEVQRKAIRMRKGFDWYFRYLHRFQLYLFRHWGGKWEHPFLDFDVMRAMEALPECYTNSRVAIPMAKHLVPELNHIPDWQTKDLRARGYRTVAPELLARIHDDYKRSWFGQRVEIQPSRDINYNEWWFCYNVASLCEYLLKKDYKLIMK